MFDFFFFWGGGSLLVCLHNFWFSFCIFTYFLGLFFVHCFWYLFYSFIEMVNEILNKLCKLFQNQHFHCLNAACFCRQHNIPVISAIMHFALAQQYILCFHQFHFLITLLRMWRCAYNILVQILTSIHKLQLLFVHFNFVEFHDLAVVCTLFKHLFCTHTLS